MYLEKDDFSPNGDLDYAIDNEPVFVMFQATGCGHCTSAKPSFQQLADERIVKCMTVHADGERPTERAITQIIDKIYPGFRGYPSYMLFMPSGEKIPYNGGRDKQAMKRFLESVISR